jgi:hypothetical protein
VVQRLRHLHDTQEIEGPIPSAITGGKWFVSVPGARVLGKNEDRVRFSNEPLMKAKGVRLKTKGFDALPLA